MKKNHVLVFFFVVISFVCGMIFQEHKKDASISHDNIAVKKAYDDKYNNFFENKEDHIIKEQYFSNGCYINGIDVYGMVFDLIDASYKKDITLINKYPIKISTEMFSRINPEKSFINTQSENTYSEFSFSIIEIDHSDNKIIVDYIQSYHNIDSRNGNIVSGGTVSYEYPNRIFIEYEDNVYKIVDFQESA